jgi:hypothetical protein
MAGPEITRHVLKSDGAWVDLRDVSLVRAGERKQAMGKALEAAAYSGGKDDPSIDAVIKMLGATTDFAEFAAAAVLVKWFVPYLADAPVEHDRRNLTGIVAQINDLTTDDYDRLMELIAPAAEALMPRISTPDDADDPASPSEPVSD